MKNRKKLLSEQKRKDVAEFLKEFKEIIASGKRLYVVNRVKNNRALVALGLTRRNRKDEILDLSVLDYCSGPEKDRDRLGQDVWFFGKRIVKQEVYMKLAIASVGNEKIAKCISFHPAEYPLRYPFKKS